MEKKLKEEKEFTRKSSRLLLLGTFLMFLGVVFLANILPIPEVLSEFFLKQGPNTDRMVEIGIILVGTLTIVISFKKNI